MLRYQVIKQALLEEISKRKPLEKIPSRIELCRLLDTTRTTLDKAIKELEQEGIVFCRDGSGTYVAIPRGYDIQRAQNWGVLVPDITEDVYSALVRGVEDVADSHNINLIMCNFDHDPQKYEQYLYRLILTDVSGLIVVPVFCRQIAEDTRLGEMILKSGKPFVLCNRDISGIKAPVVSSNNFYGAYIATKHLIQKGYRSIAYMANYNYRTSIERYHGYIAALQEAGIPIEWDRIIIDSVSGEVDGGYTAACSLFQKGTTVDAIFCFSELINGIYQAAKDFGRSIPDDLGIVSYDNTHLSRQVVPAVTTVEYHSREIGRIAAELLLDQTNGKGTVDFLHHLVQPKLIERGSCTGPVIK